MQRTYLTAAAVLVGGLVGWPSGALAQDAPLVFRVPVTGVVEMGLAPFIERAIREAESAGVSVVVLDIDTTRWTRRFGGAHRRRDFRFGCARLCLREPPSFFGGCFDRSGDTRHLYEAGIGPRRRNAG